MKCTQLQVQHLLLRAGFGDSYDKVTKYIGLKPGQILESEWDACSVIKDIHLDTDFTGFYEKRQMSQADRQMMAKKGRNAVKELNTRWLKEMVNANSGFREKMAFFWHDHFACRSQNPILIQDYLGIIRKHALGNFGDLLRTVSKSPAMLQYLNNQQNKKTAPNENFAREVMELFTLGRDQGYTEKDISEAARAFTGWGFKKGKFVERIHVHDDGIKTILGRSGNFDGDDVLNLLLENPQTAKHIAEKWVRYFVHPSGNPELENKVADELYRTDYDIKRGMQIMFASEEFYAEKNIGTRIKSPIELIASVQRQLHVQIEDQNSLIFLQRMMGQVLFDPPNVAGWPDGKEWVDSATLMFRMNLPKLIFRSALIQNELADSFDDNDKFKMVGALKKLKLSIDFDQLSDEFEKLEELNSYLLQVSSSTKITAHSLIDQVVEITSKPEFQLC